MSFGTRSTTGGGSGSGSALNYSITIDTYSNLNASYLPADNTGVVALVTSTEGSFLLRKEKGLYYSDGSTWTRMKEVQVAFKDEESTFYDDVDTTKRFDFELTEISTGTTRTVSIPDKNIKMAGYEGTELNTEGNINMPSGSILTVEAIQAVDTDGFSIFDKDGNIGAFVPDGGGIIPYITDTTLEVEGIIKWDGSNFKGYNGTTWLTLDVQATSGGGWTEETDRIRQTDASKRFVLGRTGTQYTRTQHADLVTNGGFDADTDWTKGTGWSIGAGVATCDGTQTADTELKQTVTVTNEQWYVVSFDVSGTTAWTGGGDSFFNVILKDPTSGREWVPRISGDTCFQNSGTYYNTDDEYVFEIYYEGSTSAELIIRANENFAGSLDNVALRVNYGAEDTTPVFDHYGQTDDNIYEEYYSFGQRNASTSNTGLKSIAFATQFASSQSESGLRKAVVFGGRVQDKFSNYPDFFVRTRGMYRFLVGHYGETRVANELAIGDPSLNLTIPYNSQLWLYRYNANVTQTYDTGVGTPYSWILTAAGAFHLQDRSTSQNMFSVKNEMIGIKNSTPTALLDVNGEIKLASATTSGNGRIQYDGTFKAYDGGVWNTFAFDGGNAYTFPNAILTGANIDNADIDGGTIDGAAITATNAALTTPTLTSPKAGNTLDLDYNFYEGNLYPLLIPAAIRDADFFKHRAIESLEYYDGAAWQTWSVPANFTNMFDGDFETYYDVPYDDGGIDRRKFRFVMNVGVFRYIHAIAVVQYYQTAYRDVTIKVEHSSDNGVGDPWNEVLAETSAFNEATAVAFMDYTNSDGYVRVTIDATDGGSSQNARICMLSGLTVRPEYFDEGDTQIMSRDYERNVTFPADVTVTGDISAVNADFGGTLNVDGSTTLSDTVASGTGIAPIVTVRNTNGSNYPVLRIDGNEAGQPGNIGQIEAYNNNANSEEVVAIQRVIRGDAAYNAGGWEWYVGETLDPSASAELYSILRMKGSSTNKTFFDINVGQRDCDVRAYKSGSSNTWLSYDAGNDALAFGTDVSVTGDIFASNAYYIGNEGTNGTWRTEINADGYLVDAKRIAGTYQDYLWNDYNIPGLSLRGGAASPDLIALNGATYIYGYAFDGGSLTESVSGVVEILHGYKEGTDVLPHIHWQPSTNAAGNVKWFIEYYYVVPNGSATTTTTLSVVDAASGEAWSGEVIEFGVIDGTDFVIGTQIHFAIYRDPTDAQDTYTDDAILDQFGIHVQVESNGSINTFTK